MRPAPCDSGKPARSVQPQPRSVCAPAAASLRRDGYLPLRAWLPEKELGRLRDLVALTKANAAAGAGCAARPGNNLIGLRWCDPVVEALLGNRAAMASLEAAIDTPDLKWISGYISTMPAFGQRLPWHQDWWCWHHEVSCALPPTQVLLLCYLTDVCEANGALRVIPSSHRRRLSLHAKLPLPENCFDLPHDHPAISEHPDERTIIARAGDAIALDYRVLHSAFANRSTVDRDVVLLSFTPDWAAIPDVIRSHLRAHYALPSAAETASGDCTYGSLIPRYTGRLRDLPLSRQPASHWRGVAEMRPSPRG